MGQDMELHVMFFFLVPGQNSIALFYHLHTQFLLTSLGSYENLMVGSIFTPSGKWEITHSAQTLFKNQLGIMIVGAQPFHAISRGYSQHIGDLQDTHVCSPDTSTVFCRVTPAVFCGTCVFHLEKPCSRFLFFTLCDIIQR